MQLAIALGVVIAVVILGMVLVAPWLERLEWRKRYNCAMPSAPDETPVGRPARNWLATVRATLASTSSFVTRLTHP